MKKIDKILSEIDYLYEYFRHSRSHFPYLNPENGGVKIISNFNINSNLKAQIKYSEPVTENFISFNNRVGHFLNQNFLIRLFALLDYYSIVSEKEKIIKNLPGSDEVDILRRLRKLFSHTSGKYNPLSRQQKLLVDRIIIHFKLELTDPEDFPISIDTVITPIVIKTKEYLRSKLGE